MSVKVPDSVMNIIKHLNANSFEAYIVGGCVRDSILGITPKDWDITTNAKPHEIKMLFKNTIDTGLVHGTVTVCSDDDTFEVTTFRIDGKYLDNRRPDKVTFTSSIEEDLSRRDFTINSIAYHPEVGYIDPFKGRDDIASGIIRTVGDADTRFKEDALRMLRCIRFSAQLDFSIDTATFNSIKCNSYLIENISSERIRDELTKIIMSPNPHFFSLLRFSGLLQHILPEFDACYDVNQNNPYHVYNVAEHSLKAVESVKNTFVLRWTMLLHDIGKAVVKTTDDKNIDHFYGHPEESVKLAASVLKRLKFDNKSIYVICKLIKYHDRNLEPRCKSIRKAIRIIGDEAFNDLLEVKIADMNAQNPKFLNFRIEKIEMIRKIYKEIKDSGQCTSLKDLAVSGDDLLRAGFSQGLELGKLLNKLLDMVIDDPAMNTKEALLRRAKELKQ